MGKIQSTRVAPMPVSNGSRVAQCKIDYGVRCLRKKHVSYCILHVLFLMVIIVNLMLELVNNNTCFCYGFIF